jgi:hypothetical protein
VGAPRVAGEHTSRTLEFKSLLYYQPVPPSPAEVALKHRIDEIYTAHPYYGYRKITAQLQREGMQVNHKAVARHMREMGLAAQKQPLFREDCWISCELGRPACSDARAGCSSYPRLLLYQSEEIPLISPPLK